MAKTRFHLGRWRRIDSTSHLSALWRRSNADFLFIIDDTENAGGRSEHLCSIRRQNKPSKRAVTTRLYLSQLASRCCDYAWYSNALNLTSQRKQRIPSRRLDCCELIRHAGGRRSIGYGTNLATIGQERGLGSLQLMQKVYEGPRATPQIAVTLRIGRVGQA